MSVLAEHQAALDDGRFLIQRCESCGRAVYFPRVCCPHCGSLALHWEAPQGTGTVHAVTTVCRPPADGGDHGVCLVDLDEGVRLMSRVTNRAPAEVRIGLRVRARVQQVDGRGLVVFDAIDEAAAQTAAAPPAAAVAAGARP